MKLSLNRFSSIAITGANGWLGRRVLAGLTDFIPELKVQNQNCKLIRCLVQENEDSLPLTNLGVEIVKGDIRDPESLSSLLEGMNDVLFIHIAGIIHPALLTKDFYEINLKGTENAIIAAQKHNVIRFVAVSSNSPFGFNTKNIPIFNEESAFNPYMGYGKSKWQMELMLKEVTKTNSLPEIVVMRSPWFYGPEQPLRQTIFFSMIKNGRFPLMGTGLNLRSMGYIDSLALGLLLCASVDKARGQVYWIADERPYSMKEIVETVLKVMRYDFNIKTSDSILTLPSFISDMARLADHTLQSIGLYNQKIHVLSEMNQSIVCDITKAKKELGFIPLVELEEGMRRSIGWCFTKDIAF